MTDAFITTLASAIRWLLGISTFIFKVLAVTIWINDENKT